MADAADSNKRKKKRYGGGGARCKRARGGGGARELQVGMTGVLVTCNMNERRCTSEAYNLLNEYAHRLYGAEEFVDPDDSKSEDDEEEDVDDVETALKKEVKQIKSSSEKGQRRFTAIDSGANNVIFFRTHNIDPEQLVHYILQDLHQTKKKKCRMMLRMLPVSTTCRAFPEDMEKYLSTYLEPWFKAPQQATYQISFKARNSSHNKRDDVIKSIAGVVGKLNPKNKVDLSNPELTIIVEVIKAVCCVSVVRDYTLFRKYNLQEVTKGPELHESTRVTKAQELTKDPQPQETAEKRENKGKTQGEEDESRRAGGGKDEETGNGSKEAEQDGMMDKRKEVMDG